MVLSNIFLPWNLKPYEVVEIVIKNKFLDNCITQTNICGQEGEEFGKIFAQEISNGEKGWAFLKTYLEI